MMWEGERGCLFLLFIIINNNNNVMHVGWPCKTSINWANERELVAALC